MRQRISDHHDWWTKQRMKSLSRVSSFISSARRFNSARDRSPRIVDVRPRWSRIFCPRIEDHGGIPLRNCNILADRNRIRLPQDSCHDLGHSRGPFPERPGNQTWKKPPSVTLSSSFRFTLTLHMTRIVWTLINNQVLSSIPIFHLIPSTSKFCAAY